MQSRVNGPIAPDRDVRNTVSVLGFRHLIVQTLRSSVPVVGIGAALMLGCATGKTERRAPPPTLSTPSQWALENGWRCRDASDAGTDAAATPSTSAPVPASVGDGGGFAGTKFVGNIAGNGGVRDDFSCFWNQVTPENAGKWASVEAVRDVMTWSVLETGYNYARSNGLVFKQHTLVWGSQQPTWLNDLEPAEQRVEVEEWIKEFCTRFPDVEMIDVVNEPPPHTTPAYLEALGGAGATGYDWIVQAFQWADQYCPNSILILNDYNNIEYAADHERFLKIVSALRDAGAPLDALGAQAHAAYKLPVDTVRGYLDALAATGYPVYITEYDIDLASDDAKLDVMRSQFPMFWTHPGVAGITFWGYIDGTTWRPNTGLFSASAGGRPALSWLMDYLSNEATPTP